MSLFPSQVKRVLFSVSWLLLTISMGIWWLHLGLRQAGLIADLKKTIGGTVAVAGFDELHRQSRMLRLEGGFFILLLIAGGVTLLWLSYKDDERSKVLKDFFATVTHEMKTPIASLRLQAESLEEDVKSVKHRNLLKRLIHDTKRIESQIEKALYLASISRSESLYFEKVNLAKEIEGIEMDGLNVQSSVKKDVFVRCDRRALESIFRNLFENAHNHGSASIVEVTSNVHEGNALIVIEDNGKGFSGNYSRLGRAFARHGSSSGSGIGLYLVLNLVGSMHGKVFFKRGRKGFRVEIILPEWKSN